MISVNSPKISYKKCPNCGKKIIPRISPFCSSRCARVDLSKWLNEEYRVSVNESDEFDENDTLDVD